MTPTLILALKGWEITLRMNNLYNLLQYLVLTNTQCVLYLTHKEKQVIECFTNINCPSLQLMLVFLLIGYAHEFKNTST